MVQLLYIIAGIHTILCPFTKVEESFNIQATHDILFHRLNLSQYDHNEFPGVVPRTFIGPLVISALSAPTVLFFNVAGLHKFWAQYVVRLALALSVIGAWNRLRNTLQNLYGNSFSWWFTLITATQYHFMFYISRPLPNIMVMPLVLVAFEGWLAGRQKQFLISAGASIIIFRAELAMLFGLFLILDLHFKKIEVTRLLRIVLPAGIGLVALTMTVDSIFWGRLLWPEAEVLWYNTVMNKSSDWGTSPFLWYFYSALPRGLGPSLVLIPLGLYLDRRMVQVAAPAFVFILLFSFLPHKELRFIIYVFPLLNMASAAACSYIYIRRTKAPIYELLFWGQICIVIGNIIMTLAFVSVAMTNYPGGMAMSKFHKLLKHEPYVHVHISNLAAQTGVTRFTQIFDTWKYSKNESLSQEQLQEYTHLLVESKSKYSLNVKAFANTHDIIDSVESFSHITMTYKMIPPVKIKTRPSIFILQRNDFKEYPYGKPIPVTRRISKETVPVDDKEESIVDSAEELVEDTAVNEVDFDELEDNLVVSDIEENLDANTQVEGNTFEYDSPIVEETITANVQADESIVEEKEEEEEPGPKLFKAKKTLDELKSLRQERKKKAIEVEKETVEYDSPIVEKTITAEEVQADEIIVEGEEEEEEPGQKLVKAKKTLDELKSLRQERKKKAIEKIKIETRREVVASAKEKLRDIMRRHKHIAEELSENIISVPKVEENEVDGRGDIPESQTIAQVTNAEAELKTETDATDTLVNKIQIDSTTSRTDENIDSIVEEVITRLIDRKMYDDKTKPEDIRAEDRQMIQKIVEEVLAERMNYTRTNVEKK